MKKFCDTLLWSNQQYDIISTVKTSGADLRQTQVAPTEWNTTVVCRKADEPERENMFQKVARLDHKMCGHSFAGEWSLPEKLD
jgi:hypothetical protein